MVYKISMKILNIILCFIISFIVLTIGTDIVYKAHNYKSFWFGIKLIIGAITCIAICLIIILFS